MAAGSLQRLASRLGAGGVAAKIKEVGKRACRSPLVQVVGELVDLVCAGDEVEKVQALR
jgi:hypothetical protein